MQRRFGGVPRGGKTWIAAMMFAAVPARAQVVTGRVTNDAGAGVSHVRVIAFPVTDSSEAATRVAISNDDGNFRLRLTEPVRHVIRVRRIGFAPEADQVFDASQAGNLTLALRVHAIAIALPKVNVNAKAPPPRCLAMDDSLQNPTVREWVDHALDGIRMRRLVTRDFEYRVNVSTTGASSTGGPVTISYAHDPYQRAHGWMEDDPANLVAIGRAIVRSDAALLPTEVSIITPIFRGEYCFFNAPVPAEGDEMSIRFRNRENQSGDLGILGAITFSSDALTIRRIDFEFKVGKTTVANAQLGFGTLSIEGETYPIITSRNMSRAATDRLPRAKIVDETVAYSKFTRARGSSPLRPLRLPPGS